MGKKLLTLVGIGTGIALVRREIKENPAGPVAKTVNAVTTNPTVVQATENTKRKAGEIIRKQGEAVTDKVADMVKERLFGIPTDLSPEMKLPVNSATSQLTEETVPSCQCTCQKHQPKVMHEGTIESETVIRSIEKINPAATPSLTRKTEELADTSEDTILDEETKTGVNQLPATVPDSKTAKIWQKFQAWRRGEKPEGKNQK